MMKFFCTPVLTILVVLFGLVSHRTTDAAITVKTSTGNGADGYIWNNAAGVLVGGSTSQAAASHAMFTRYRPSSNYRLEIIVLRFDLAGINLNDISGVTLALTADMPNESTPPATSTVMKPLLFWGLDPALAGQNWDETMLNYGTFPGMLPPDTDPSDGFDQGFNPANWSVLGSSPAATYLNGTQLTLTSTDLTTFVKSPGTLKTIALVYDPADPGDGGSALAQFGSKESLQYSLPDGPDEDLDLDIVTINAGDIAPLLTLEGVNPPVPQPGDFDGDGDVDGADFVAWQTNFPKASDAVLAEGDADADGDVDGADFVVWQTNFPFTPGGGASPVPEPMTIALFGIGVAAMLLCGRRCKRTSERGATYSVVEQSRGTWFRSRFFRGGA